MEEIIEKYKPLEGMSITQQPTGFFQISTAPSNTALVLILRKGRADRERA